MLHTNFEASEPSSSEEDRFLNSFMYFYGFGAPQKHMYDIYTHVDA